MTQEDLKRARLHSYEGPVDQEGGGMDRGWNDTHGRLSEAALKWIRSKIEGLEFGDVKITVRQGKIVQIDREEKERHNEVVRDATPARNCQYNPTGAS